MCTSERVLMFCFNKNMTKKDIDANFDMAAAFNRYVINHPDFKIPNKAVIVFTPKGNKKLAEKNIEIGKRALKEGEKKAVKATRTKAGWSLEPLHV